MRDEILWCISFLKHVYSLVRSFLYSTFVPRRNKTIEFDTGISATIDHQIAEGGFSYIYSAHDTHAPNVKYALKRIICPDEETKNACRSEAKVHRMLDHHDNVMKLLGIKFDNSSSNGNDRMCYMLFPLITGGSLRDEITKRRLLDSNLHDGDVQYFRTEEILNILRALLKGVKAVHDAGYAHRDIKLENIMLDKPLLSSSTMTSSYRDEEMGSGSDGNSALGTPILMDFGSATKLVTQLTDRRTVLNLTEEASQNSTVSYRAPELFDGGCRHGPDEADIDGKVDVWSCGCVLFGLMYGTSPLEMEFRQDGSIRVVECTHLRVLSGKIPSPPKSAEAAYGYKPELNDLVKWMLTVDRKERPDLDSVLERLENITPSSTGNLTPFDGITRRAIV
jgi:serine/threonine kinase 16